MQITKPVIYGVQILRELSRESPLTAEEIAKRVNISIPYSAKVCASLKRAGLLVASRASGVGWSLAKPLDKTTIAEMIQGVEGGLIDDLEGETRDMKAIRRKLRELLSQDGWGLPLSSLVR